MRASHKATILFLFGRVPGGARFYRYLTRHVMGTQGTHVDKLAHVWPGYANVWVQNGIELEGSSIWMHGGGWTIYPCLLMYMLTGKGGIVTTWEGRADNQYTAKSIDFALKQSFGAFSVPQERLERLTGLRHRSAQEILEEIDGKIIQSDRVLPKVSEDSADLLVTGGVLEHFTPLELASFLNASHSILRLGGWCSHVFDLRDHLYHADKSIPFLNHLRYSDLAYRLRYGHPLAYHNRMLPNVISRELSASGFDVQLMRRLLLPQLKWANSSADFVDALTGIDRELLASEFASASEEDLRSAAVHFLCRRSATMAK